MIKISKEIKKLIFENQERIYGGVISPRWSISEQVRDNYGEKIARRDWKDILEYVDIKNTDKILDLGSGYGFLVAYLKKIGLNAFGAEIDTPSIEISKILLKQNKLNENCILKSSVNRLPFKDNYFNFINLKEVLAYMSDLEQMVKEMYRILKKGGKVYVLTTNYQCCFETVYGLFFLPRLPRKFNELYFKLAGRKNLSFFRGINFMMPKELERIFERNNLKIHKYAGIDEWNKLIMTNNFVGRNDVIKNLSLFIRKFNLKFIWELLVKFGFYNPLIYILEKE